MPNWGPPPGGWSPPAGGWPPTTGWPTSPPTGWPPAQPAWSPGPPVGTYASFGARLGARLLDGLIIAVPAAIVFGVLFAAVPTEERLCEIDGDLEFCTTPTGGAVAVLLLVGLVLLLAVLAYYIVPIGRRGATIGQRAMGIQVVDAVTGVPIGSGRATGRYLMSLLSGSACYLGYLWMLWDDRKQTWHDKVVNSVVVKR